MLIFLFYSKSSTFGRPVLCKSMPHQEAISQIPALLWEFIFGRPSVGKFTLPLSNGNFTDSYLWLLIFLSYSMSSTFGRPGLGRSTPIQMAISQIPALTAHIFILSQSSTFGRLVLGTSPLQMAISQIPPLTAHIFILPLRAPHLAGLGLAHLSLFQMAISQIPALTAHLPFLLWELNIWQTKS